MKDLALHLRNTYIILNGMESCRRRKGHGVARSIPSGGSVVSGLEESLEAASEKGIWYLSRWKQGDSLKKMALAQYPG